MKVKSIIITGAIVIGVVIGTNIIYGVCNYIKTKNTVSTQNLTPLQQEEQAQEQEEQNLTPKQREISKYKSQLMFLVSDDGRIGLVNQTVMNDMAKLLDDKTSGMQKVTPQEVEDTQKSINTFWEQNSIFSTAQGEQLKTEYTQYLKTLNNYLNQGIKTGELNVSDLPKFSSSYTTAINNAINNVKVQLIGLGSSLDLSSATHFTVQNSGQDYNGYTN